MTATSDCCFASSAVTVSVSLVLSLLISLTLTPMSARACSTGEQEHGRVYRFLERGFDGLLNAYEAGLKIVLRHRFAKLMSMVRHDRADCYLYVIIPKGFLSATGQLD